MDARLRLKQTTDNSAFTALGPCLVDIKNGSFNDDPALEAADFSVLPTDSNVTQIPPLPATASPPDWVIAEIGGAYLGDISTTDHTQFRLYFNGTTNNKQTGWNSGDSTGNEPQLIVQYR